MLCEKILGNLKDEAFKDNNKEVDYVDIEWHEAFKKLHKKVSHKGLEMGIRLGNEVLVNGLKQGDILWADDKQIIAVNIPPCEIIEITVDSSHAIPRLCYEIGNRHAALFYEEEHNQFITPYNKPMLEMLGKLHHVNTKVSNKVLDFDKRISQAVNAHTH